MTRYLIDTDVIIDDAWDREPARSLSMVMLAGDDKVGVCAMQITEFDAGQERGERDDVDAFVDHRPCCGIAPEVGISAGNDRRA